jgi:hypothetical protein
MTTHFTPMNPDDAKDYTLFVDSSDGKLKFKGGKGNIRLIEMSYCPPVPVPTPPTPPSVVNIPLNIKDNSGSQQDVFFSIIGYQNDQWLVDPTARKWSYMDSNGNPQVCASGQNFGGYFHKIENGEYNGNLPYFFSGRITFAFGEAPPYYPVLDPTGLPMPSATDINDSWWNVINDKVEFTNKNTALSADITTLNCNTTMVDGFGAPIYLAISGSVFGYQSAGSLAVSREAAFNEFNALSPDYTAQITSVSGNFVRVLSPKTAISRVSGTGPMFPPDLMDSYIDGVWSYFSQPGNYFDVKLAPYAGFPLGVATSGSVVNGTFTFTDPAGLTSFTIDKPSTSDLLGCAGVFNVTNPVNGTWDGNIKVAVAGAMNRGVAVNPDVCNVNNFYSGANHNQYAKTVHDISVNKANYAFPYDDACNLYSSDISDNQPSGMWIQLQPWYVENA